MSINLRNSLIFKWKGEEPNPYEVLQINTHDSELIYGDGVHENICKRLEEYYVKRTKEMVEYEANSKGVKNPWKCKDHRYYEKLLKEYLRDNWYMVNLRRLKAISASKIEWFLL